MINTSVNRRDDKDRRPPDLMRAAMNDDVQELLACLRDGQDINAINHLLGVNPMHMACMKQSYNFFFAAIENAKFDPWVRDHNQRTAFDHAQAIDDKRLMKALFPLMYPVDPTPDTVIRLEPN